MKLHHHNKQTTSQNYQALNIMLEKFVTSQVVKSFAIGSFLKCNVVKIANDSLC